MEKSTQPEAVSSVLKVFNILVALGEQKDIGVTELSQRLMTSKATTYRFLQTMKGLGFVAQEGEDDKYSLTLKLFELGATALDYVDLTTLADEPMRLISEQTHEAVHLGVLDADSIVYVHKYGSSYNLCMQTRIGSRKPVYCTAIGKILMAARSDEEIAEVCRDTRFVKRTERTINSVEEFVADMDTVRQQHYGEDNEEQEPGLRCIAAPIYDRFGNTIAGISISFPMVRFEDGLFQNYIDLLQQAGKTISAKLGFHEYPSLG
ncbi:DNA-binding transcriptional regulator KdgR [Echinimonas agarilytica]|uniref:DNA-binding transcriptional regulator KdgR n=1 Tax=Echinimonas agarilytica TaxID=1215918 RepID=A0AA42B8Y8_9GAMM|nr:DNA-binding transcriptional regulator KdgR [Echinimonas agarilytica]MCM2680726.1 DNA-binding transcriptional regulator KdgR [Echinimonas agarilytica]